MGWRPHNYIHKERRQVSLYLRWQRGNSRRCGCRCPPSHRKSSEFIKIAGWHRRHFCHHCCFSWCFGGLFSSFPGRFAANVAQIVNNITLQLYRTGSPLLINVYPFFALVSEPQRISLNNITMLCSKLEARLKWTVGVQQSLWCNGGCLCGGNGEGGEIGECQGCRIRDGLAGRH